MSLKSLLQFLADHATDIEIIELNQSTATVEMSAKEHNVETGQIAKTLSLKVKDTIILVVAKG
ncbi:YbaK/EbsC family protein, partial [Salmonella enterica subsp. enterica serovar Infantis]